MVILCLNGITSGRRLIYCTHWPVLVCSGEGGGFGQSLAPMLTSRNQGSGATPYDTVRQTAHIYGNHLTWTDRTHVLLAFEACACAESGYPMGQ
jgi:hypothetical protein